MKPLALIILLLSLATLSAKAEDSLYEMGQKALRDHQWATAAALFESAEKQRQRTDGALYWRAYALGQMGRKREAGGVARQVLRRFPDSPWADDANALLAELGQQNESNDQEQLTVFALSRLIEKDPDRAMPLIEKMLNNDPSPESRRHLLFLLAASESEQGNRLVLDIAVSSSDPELQIQAIHLIGAGSGEQALPRLMEIYRASSSEQVRRAVIDAHLMVDDPGRLEELISQEPNPDLQRHAIVALGAMAATGPLRSIYQNLTGARERAAVLEALAISGDVSQLAGIIESETDPQLRVAAIRSLGLADDNDGEQLLARLAETATSQQELMAILEAVIIMDGNADTVLAVARRSTSAMVSRQAIQTLAILDQGEAVMDLYQELKGQSAEVDAAVLEALMILDEGTEIAVDIARNSDDPRTVAMALQTLGIMDASEQIGALYGEFKTPELKRMALQQLLVADDGDGLLKILQSETDPQIRIEAIHTLVVLDLNADQELLRIYQSGTEAEKSAIIETWMIQESEAAIIKALDVETDPLFKRRLVEALIVMDSQAADEYLFDWLEK